MRKFLMTFNTMFLVTVLSLIFATRVYGETRPNVDNAEFALNRASLQTMQKYQFGRMLVREKSWIVKLTYDFSKSGGAIGTQNLQQRPYATQARIPKGSIITNCVIDVITAPAGATATIAIGTGNASSTTDIKAATAIASYTGLVACIPTGVAANMIKVTSDATPTMTIATAALTAGKFNVLIEYALSDTN